MEDSERRLFNGDEICGLAEESAGDENGAEQKKQREKVHCMTRTLPARRD